MIIIGRKTLPDFAAHRGYWGFVDLVNADYEKIMEQLHAKQYETAKGMKTNVPPAHAVGHGVYVLATHRRKHSHLVYVLELPEQPHEAQEMFNIGKEGSYILQVKNPLLPANEQIGLPHIEKKTMYSEEIQEKAFGRGEYQLRWASPYPIDILNATGAEILIIPAREDIKAELGKVGQELEEQAKFEKLPNMGEIIEQLHARHKEHKSKK